MIGREGGAGSGGSDATGGGTVIATGVAGADSPEDNTLLVKSEPASRSDTLRMGNLFTWHRF
jgi:hypothetical protein